MREVAGFLDLQHQGVEESCGGEGGQAEAGEGGVLEVGAGVGEEDERHGCGRRLCAVVAQPWAAFSVPRRGCPVLMFEGLCC